MYSIAYGKFYDRGNLSSDNRAVGQSGNQAIVYFMSLTVLHSEMQLKKPPPRGEVAGFGLMYIFIPMMA